MLYFDTHFFNKNILKSIPKHILIPLVTLVTGLFFGSALQIALAWTVPSATPPGNNVAPPLNTSAVDQAKTGSLTVNGAGERMQAPRFIDNDNTNFFLDPNSSSKLSFATFDNLESLGFVSANRMVASAYMQAPVFYDNDNINYKVDPNSWSVVSAIYAYSQIYSPVLYDTNNPSYYVDPNGNSQLNAVYANNWFRAQGNAGFYFQDHDGGWTMWDDTWLRSVSDKPIYSGGDICTNAGGWKCLSTRGGGGCVVITRAGEDPNDNIAYCPAGTHLTGGGVGNFVGGFIFLSAPWNPSTGTWCTSYTGTGAGGCTAWKVCAGVNSGLCTLLLTAYAVCCAD